MGAKRIDMAVVEVITEKENSCCELPCLLKSLLNECLVEVSECIVEKKSS